MWPSSLPDYKWPQAESRRRAWRWMSAALFHVAHAAGRLARLFSKRTSAILAIRTDGIGDAVLAEPLLCSLSRQFADHELHLWAPQETCDLLRAAPYITSRSVIPRGFKQGNLLLFNSLSVRMKLAYRLGRWKFAVAAYLSHSPEPLGNWLLSSARADQRWYAPGNLENQFAAQQRSTTQIATRPLAVTGTHWHDLTRNAELARQWGAEIEQIMPTVHLDELAWWSAAEQSRSWRRIAEWLGAELVVGLMPAASMLVKEYPAAGWAETGAALWRQGIICALIGGPADSARIEDVSRRFGSLPHLKLSSALDLPAMAALIGSLDGLLSVDTGLAHVSMAQDVPTVVLVGGGHPQRFFPWPLSRRATVLNYPVPCEGCRNRCHLRQPECVTRIDPMEIAGAMAGLLRRPAPLPLRATG